MGGHEEDLLGVEALLDRQNSEHFHSVFVVFEVRIFFFFCIRRVLCFFLFLSLLDELLAQAAVDFFIKQLGIIKVHRDIRALACSLKELVKLDQIRVLVGKVLEHLILHREVFLLFFHFGRGENLSCLEALLGKIVSQSKHFIFLFVFLQEWLV